MNTQEHFGRRPIYSSHTDPLPEQIQPQAMAVAARVKRAVCNRLARSISPEVSLQSKMLENGLYVSNSMANRLAKHASPDTLDKKTCEALRGEYKRQANLRALLDSDVPIALDRARLIYQEACRSGDQAQTDLFAAMRSLQTGGNEQETEQALRNLLASRIPDAVMDGLKALDTAKKRGEFREEDFDELLNGTHPEFHHQNTLQLVVDQARDIVMIDLLLKSGARLGKKDFRGKTEIDIAVDNGDYYLASKLKLALNYQTLCDQADSAASSSHSPENSIVYYQFDEGTMSFAEAEKAFFEKIKNHPVSFTHGFLACRQKSGKVVTRLIHSPCQVDNSMEATELKGEDISLNSRQVLNEMHKQREQLTRRPLHLSAQGQINFIAQQQKNVSDKHWKSMPGRMTWGAAMGCLAGTAGLVVDGNLSSAMFSGVTSACTNVFHSNDVVTHSAELVGQCVGGTAGFYFGAPAVGAQLGGLCARTLKGFGLLNKPTTMIDAIGDEFKKNNEVLKDYIVVGGCVCAVSSLGILYQVPEELLYKAYIAVGGVLSLPVFKELCSNRKFLCLMAGLLGMSIVGATVMTVAGAGGYIIGIGGSLWDMAGMVMPSYSGAQAFCTMSGVLWKQNDKLKTLKSVYNSGTNLFLRGVFGLPAVFGRGYPQLPTLPTLSEEEIAQQGFNEEAQGHIAHLLNTTPSMTGGQSNLSENSDDDQSDSSSTYGDAGEAPVSEFTSAEARDNEEEDENEHLPEAAAGNSSHHSDMPGHRRDDDNDESAPPAAKKVKVSADEDGGPMESHDVKGPEEEDEPLPPSEDVAGSSTYDSDMPGYGRDDDNDESAPPAAKKIKLSADEDDGPMESHDVKGPEEESVISERDDLLNGGLYPIKRRKQPSAAT